MLALQQRDALVTMLLTQPLHDVAPRPSCLRGETSKFGRSEIEPNRGRDRACFHARLADLNGDNVIDSADLDLVLDCLAGADQPPGC